jgi:hypothetical protein
LPSAVKRAVCADRDRMGAANCQGISASNYSEPNSSAIVLKRDVDPAPIELLQFEFTKYCAAQ